MSTTCVGALLFRYDAPREGPTHASTAPRMWLLLAGVLTACAPARIELDPRVREVLPAASVVQVVAYPTDAPSLLTAKAMTTGAMFGAIGGAVVGVRAVSLGKVLMAKDKVVDDLSSQLATALSDELKGTLPNLKRAASAPPGDEVDDLRRAGLRPYVLDVRSGGNIAYYPGNWARYRLMYWGRVRVVDTDNGRVVWQGVCKNKGPEEAANRPTLDEIEADDGVAYWRMLGDAIAACATDLLKQYRGEAPTPSRPLFPRARPVELGGGVLTQLQVDRPEDLLELGDRRGARDRRGDARAVDHPRQRYLRGRGADLRRHLLDGGEHGEAPVVHVDLLNIGRARGGRQVLARAVLAGEEPAGQ